VRRSGECRPTSSTASGGCNWHKDSLIRHAARSGCIAVVEWLRQQQGIAIDAATLSWAASAGQIAMCAHLRSMGCSWDESACSRAAAGGHLGALRWLRERGCPCVVSNVCIAAARNGHTDILDYAIEQGEVLNAKLLTDALFWAGSSNKLQAA
jgi:hypothetical protein